MSTAPVTPRVPDAVAQQIVAQMSGKPAPEPKVEEQKEEPKEEQPVAETKQETSSGEDVKVEETKAEEAKVEETEITSDQEKELQGKLDEIAGREENKDKSEEELKEVLLKETESSLHTENKPEEEKSEDPTSSSDSVDVNALIKEQTQGKFETLEALVEKAEQKPEDVFANEQIQKLNDLAKNGVDIAQVLKFQSLGISELDPANPSDARRLLKLQMQQEDPEATDREMEILLKLDYPIDEDDDEAEENEVSKAKMSRMARKAKKDLLKKESELELPQSNSINPVDAAKQREQAEMKKKEDAQKWKQVVDNNLMDYSRESFEIEKDYKFDFQVDSNSIKDIAASMQNPISRYVNKSGDTDMNKLRKEMTILNNYDKIIKAIHKQAVSMGRKSIVDGLKNPSVKGSVKSSKEGKSITQQIADKLGGRI